jgi:RNA polymerase sigma-70 factor, ECF subfamily
MTDDRPRVSTIPNRLSSSGPLAPDDQDCLLLHRMADGDESAFTQLYDRLSHRVHTLAYWILKDADDAEDVVEETFWQAWRSAGEFNRARAAASTWILMIARTRALDRLRARRRRAERTSQAGASSLLDSLDGNSYAAAQQPELIEPDRKLSEALSALPADQRAALELAFFSGLSHAEIADRTKQPLGTIKTRIRLAMEKLRERLSAGASRVRD